jgi:NAD synthase
VSSTAVTPEPCIHRGAVLKETGRPERLPIGGEVMALPQALDRFRMPSIYPSTCKSCSHPAGSGRLPQRTVFTRFVPPLHANDRPGRWQRYFSRWNVRPVLVYRVRSLISCARATRLIPPATVDAQRHGPSLGQGEPVYDITFENVQAGLRTDYLFRLANHHGRIVIGTGDLSELALGWCTYGVGDQMAHYNVNSGVPKTLIQHLIRWGISSGQFSDDVSQTLRAIPAAEISPELVPVEEGQSPQSTEAAIGPYALQDFNLYYTLRFGFRPSQVAFLAMHAWDVDAKGDWPSGVPADQRHHYDLGD